MPLHLLPKKSWNPYNPAAIARVRADEAAAAAREEEIEQRQHEEDAARRIAILRGETPPPLEAPPPPVEDVTAITGQKRDRDTGERKEWRKKRRLAGEDDTDRDIRLAREEEMSERRDKMVRDVRDDTDVSLTDHRGHIQLFAPKQPSVRERNAELEAEKKKKEREYEDQYTMRFSNAAGFRQTANGRPWYAENGPKAIEMTAEEAAEVRRAKKGTNVWGREDDGRISRDAARITAADPMAAMKRAQSQLKSASREKERWIRDREREMEELRQEQRRHRRKHHHEKSGEDGLEGFSLDEPSSRSHSHSQEKHEHSRRHHRRSKSSAHSSSRTHHRSDKRYS